MSVERFWCSRDGAYTLDRDGFLFAPDANWRNGESANLGVVRTAELIEERCLVLLGEPGAGKSSTLEAAGQLVAVEMPIVSFDLAGYGSEERLVREIFSDPRVADWIAGAGQLCLVLDSLDEARMRIPQVGAILADCLRKLPADRLFLRIVCRTADWPIILEERLEGMYDSITLVEILPLRREDASRIASAWCDPLPLIDEVVRAGAGPLAARPLTLRLLARSFDRTGTLPERGAALYAAGVRALCDEQSSARLDAGLRGDLPLDQRVAVARRIAAATVFGGASAFWTGADSDVAGEDVALGYLAEGSEPTLSGSVNITVSALLEVVGTGLFTSRGIRRLGWAHATFADFLAAEWVVVNDLSDLQVRPLFLGPDGRCWPQARLAAAWCVAIAPGRFGFLTTADPEAFQGEVEIPGDSLRAAVVDGLFMAASKLTVSPWERSYKMLRHPHLAQQIRPHLRDTDSDRRRLAFELADECSVFELLDELAAIALDPAAQSQDRVAAGRALAHLSDGHRTALLRPLALSYLTDLSDPEDDLKGVALSASWPNAMSNAEVFSVLTPRRRRNFHGSYALFMGRFCEAIDEADIQDGLQWLLRHSEAAVGDHVLSAIANRVVMLAATNPSQPGVVNAFVTLVIARMKHYEGFLFKDFRRNETRDPFADPKLRHAVVLSVLKSYSSDEVAYRLSGSGPYSLGVVRSEDLSWLARICAGAGEDIFDSLRLLFRMTLDIEESEHRELLLTMPSVHPLYDEFTRAWVEPVALDSLEANTRRQSWAMSRVPKAATPDDVNEEIEKLLDRFSEGESFGFWGAIRLLTVDPGMKHYGADFDPDVVGMKRWSTLTDSAQKRLIGSAEAYLLSHPCQPERWLGKLNVVSHPAVAGYRAMLILLRLAPDRLSALPGSVWVEWAPVLAATSTALVNGADWDDKLKLLRFLDEEGCSATRTALVAHVTSAVSVGERPLASNEADFLWNNELADIYMDLLLSAPSGSREEVLASLVRRDPKPLRGLMVEWLQDLTDIDRRRLAATTIFDHDLDWGWSIVESAFNSDFAFAEQVLAQSMIVRGFEPFDDVTPKVLANIYVWLRRWFPSETDPQYDEAHMVGSREQIGQWRDGLVSALRQDGSLESIQALRSIAVKLPDDRWLQRAIAIAEANLRRKQWTPFRLTDLLGLAKVRGTSVVNNSVDLSVAVATTFDEIGVRLSGATPDSHYLWDTYAGRPKSEDELSDYLANELNRALVDRGVIVNREVQVRRNQPSGMGERTDLLIEALVSGAARGGRISLPVEVKGAWNVDLLTAMREQLSERYMRDVAADAGLYVVAWPDLASWTDLTDRRRKTLASVNRSAVESELANQSSALEIEGLRVQVVHLWIGYRRPR